MDTADQSGLGEGHRARGAHEPLGSSEAPTPQATGAAKKGNLPGQYDEAAKAIINRVKPRTMTNHAKLFGLVLATRYVARHQIPGDIVECGVWRGGSMQAVALTLLEAGVTDRELHLFDTFEGMPPPTSKDVRHDGVSAAELMEHSTAPSSFGRSRRWTTSQRHGRDRLSRRAGPLP